MTFKIVTVLCHYGGRIQDGPNGVEYSGGNPPLVLRVDNDIVFNELRRKVCELMKWDENKDELEINGKLLISLQPHRFVSLPIVDDSSITAMFDMIKAGYLRCIDLYLMNKSINNHASHQTIAPQIDKPINKHAKRKTIVQQIDKPINHHASHKNIAMQIDNFHDQLRVSGSNCAGGSSSPQPDKRRSSSRKKKRGVDPGSNSNVVLRLQRDHRSEAVWTGEDTRGLGFRQHKVWPLHPRIQHLVRAAGFFGVHQIGHIPLDHALLSALVERWRRETHTFHFTVGEMTITLEDVAVLLGLPVDGRPVTGHKKHTWVEVVKHLLGEQPPPQAIMGASIRLPWLAQTFSGPPPDDATPETLMCYARAYIMAMFGSILFTDGSGDTVPLIYLPLLEDLNEVRNYSWGGAVLAYLYRSLCRGCMRGARQMNGCLFLLQIWSWERLNVGRPEIVPGKARHKEEPCPLSVLEGPPEVDGDDGVGPANWRPPLGARWNSEESLVRNSIRVLSYYRDLLDQQRDHQVIWQPYTTERLETVPPICLQGQHIWRAKVPLICFEIVELYFPDRVLRQFGLNQHIPERADTRDELHMVDRRSKTSGDWLEHTKEWLAQWEARADRVVNEMPFLTSMDHYFKWYDSVTRRKISPPVDSTQPQQRLAYEPQGSSTHRLIEGLIDIARAAIQGIRQTTHDAEQTIHKKYLSQCRAVLEDVGEKDRLQRALRDVAEASAANELESSAANELESSESAESDLPLSRKRSSDLLQSRKRSSDLSQSRKTSSDLQQSGRRSSSRLKNIKDK